jgi:hypothetical protein
MTASQKTTYAAKVRALNIWDTLADPDSIYYPRADMYFDTLHEAAGGACTIGRTVGPALAQLFARGGWTARDAMIATDAESINPGWQMTGSVAITATNGETAGAGGANMDGQGGTSVTGVLPTNWLLIRPSTAAILNAAQPVGTKRLNVVASKTLDKFGNDAVRLRITGNSNTDLWTLRLYQANRTVTQAQLANLNAGTGVADGDSIRSVSRVLVPAGSKGLLGLGPDFYLQTGTYPSSGYTFATGATSNYTKHLNGAGLLDMTVLSQPQVLPAGFVASASSGGATIQHYYLIHIGGGEIYVDITISGLGLVKNR